MACNNFKNEEKECTSCVYIVMNWLGGSTHTEVLSISVTAFGNRVIKEVIQVQ